MYDFNCRASRLINTSYKQVDSALKIFIDYIENTDIINDYINTCNRENFNVENEVKDVQQSYGRYIFDLGNTVEEEVFSSYKILKYIVDNNCDITMLGRGYSHSNKYQDIVKEFNHGLSLILIQHIEAYLRKIIISMGYDEEVTYMITVHGGQVNISKDNSTINATQNNNGSNIDELMRLVSSIKALLDDTIPEDEKELINDNIEAIQEQLKNDKPKKGLIKTCINGLNSAILGIPNAIELCENLKIFINYIQQQIH